MSFDKRPSPPFATTRFIIWFKRLSWHIRSRPRSHWEVHVESLTLATLQGKSTQAALHQRAINDIAEAIAENLQAPTLCRGLLQAALPVAG
jgi:hypothetical protein